MRVVVQVVDYSEVKLVKDNDIRSINGGLTLLVGFRNDDTKEIVEALAKKVANLRVFMDECDKMNLSILDKKLDILSISQFTLYGDVKKGNRPGFSEAMIPNEAIKLYNYFNECLRTFGINVVEGQFGADMLVRIDNIGPTTIILDSEIIVKKQ